MSSTWIVATSRIESDLAPYHDGCLCILFEVLETFRHELLVRDSLCGLIAKESEACRLIRCCMVTYV